MMQPSINLMTHKAKLRECSRNRVRFWLRMLMSICMILAAVGVVLQLISRRSDRQVGQLEARYEPVAQLKKANLSLEKQIKRIHTEAEFVLALSDQDSLVNLLGLVGQALQDEYEELFLDRLQIDHESDLTSAQKRSEGVLAVSGITRDNTALERFVERLRAEVPFQQIEIVGTREIQQKHMKLQEFHVQSKFP